MLTRSLTPIKFFQGLNKKTMHLVDEFYDQNAIFQDPLVELSNCGQIKNYYANLYEHVKEINFTFQDEIQSDNKTTLVWRMSLITAGLNKGKPIYVDGVSVIKFDPVTQKAVYHRDYFDLGEFVYEKLPLVGVVIRFAKQKMASHKERKS